VEAFLIVFASEERPETAAASTLQRAIDVVTSPLRDERGSARRPRRGAHAHAWSSDRNAGFSQADPVALYLPPVADPHFGYQPVNVEQRHRMRSSLLNWMGWVLRVRAAHRDVFGRGEIAFLHGENRRMLAYSRALG